MSIQSVGIVGCGLMGSGIAQVCAQKGIRTVVREVNSEALRRGMDRIHAFMAEGVKRGKVAPEAMDATLAALTGTTSLAGLKECDLVIEAVTEKLEEKRSVFAELDRVCKPSTILASNTSSLPIASMASVTKRPAQCIGLHFMNPVPVMKLVEIVRPEAASEETYRTARAFVESLGKTTVTAKDTPGFIVNLLLIPYMCEAVRALERGLASKEDIDAAMKLGCGMPMGPIELLDFVGLDTALSVVDILQEGFRDARYEAPPLLRRMVAEGRHGKKVGRGFYEYASA